MKLHLNLVGVAVLVAGCAVWRAGEEPDGARLRAQAEPVLRAIKAFRQDTGAFPTAPSEMIPKYIAAWPNAPQVQFDEYSGHVRFSYSTSWPQAGHVECVAKFGAVEFTCNGI
jgi:hypothetical protein